MGYAQNPWKNMGSRFDGAIAEALTHLRSEKLKPLDLQDNLDLWQRSLGVGAQVEMTKNWALRLDVDRYRPKFPGGAGREGFDTVMLRIRYDLGGD